MVRDLALGLERRGHGGADQLGELDDDVHLVPRARSDDDHRAGRPGDEIGGLGDDLGIGGDGP